jgi:anoctamin-10
VARTMNRGAYFSQIDEAQAIKEYRELVEALDEVGLELAVRHGNGASLLIFVKAPANLVGNWVYKAR